MSAPLFASDVLFLQRFLMSADYYRGALDGIWGPRTDAAVAAFEARTDEIAGRYPPLDPLSERNVRSLQPAAQEAARAFMRRILAAAIPARIISGTRTYAEQNALFKQGRFGNYGPVVTNARGGQSNHNFGIAWDVGIFLNGAYQGESPYYRRAAEVGLVPGLEWGGAWRTFPDPPHYQLATGTRTIAAVRDRFESGLALV